MFSHCQHYVGKIYQIPNWRRLNECDKWVQIKMGLSSVCWCHDGSHIPTAAPELNHTDYYNRKGWHSMILQGVVDHDYLFRDICVGWPGSVHDARVFASSSIVKRIKEGLLSAGQSISYLGCQIPAFLIGDSAYPLQTWLMKPFANTGILTREQQHFNYRLSRARMVVENTFGRLKARWRRLQKRNDMSIEHIPCIISACCILHNVCEIHGETFNETWLEDVNNTQQPQVAVQQPVARGSAPQRTRNALMQYLCSEM